jgi:hypothetical protein
MDKGMEDLRRGSCFNLKETEETRRKGIMIAWTDKRQKIDTRKRREMLSPSDLTINVSNHHKAVFETAVQLETL